jgi:crotonobetaine/carnitine-CoA ligase
VFPVSSEHSEDEVMATLVLKEGPRLEAADVINFCQANMAYYMVPRFVEFAAHLPKTMTEKVEKYKLRAAAEARLSEIWDREKAGIKITR